MSSPTDPADEDQPAGFACGVAAYGLWGIIPLYLRQLAGVPVSEFLAHRVWWSFVVLAVATVVLKQGAAVRAVLANPRTALMLLASSTLIALNWLTYIYAVSVEQIVQAGLGYFVTPLANVLLGVLLLGERLRPLQIFALVLAAAGVVVMTIHGGEIPWIALALVTTFSLYGLLRKIVKAEALVGLFVETLILSPVALGFLIYLGISGNGVFAGLSQRQDWWLLASAPVTTIPLVCFAAAARGLRMTTLGFLQFLTPSLQVCVALFIFGEPFTRTHLWAFPLIWGAVVLYLADAVRSARRRRQVA